MSEADDQQKLQTAYFLHQKGDLNEAANLYRQLIKRNPNNFGALHFLGVIEATVGNIKEAKLLMARSLSAQPQNIQFIENYATILFQAGDYESALKICQQGFRLDNSNISLLYVSAISLFKHSKLQESITEFDKLILLQPNHIAALNERGSVLAKMKQYDAASLNIEKVLAINPQYAEAHLNKGNIACELKRYDEALVAYDKALALKADLADAWLGRGNVFVNLKRYDEAYAAYDRALALKPNLKGVEGSRLHCKMHLCDWSNFDSECTHLIASIRNGNENSSPFSFLAIPSSAVDQLQCAKLYAKTISPTPKHIWQGPRYDHDRIRVAYLSADFRQHPVSLLTAGMFEQINKSRFNVTAISIGPDDNSEMRQRLKASFERFIDVNTYSDDQIANLIKELEVDILVDLMGFTENARTSIFSRRCAPIQINYLGYAGTMGADFIDYLISDPTLIPSRHKSNYVEKIVYLPNSHMPHDEAGRVISDRNFERADFGLPQTGFVFCCFNNSYKFNPNIFDCWARILETVEGSVLWLSAPNSTALANLRREIGARGLSPDRLVFANQLPKMGEHLARVRLADIFLDTLPYNAHTTANDALWAGVPVLTCIGETFAGRVAASLLNAIGLPELITTTLEGYERMAIDLATHPEKLAAIKSKLAKNRLTRPLFDTKLFTKHIEAAYTATYERYQAGLTPDHLVIPQ